MNTWNSTDEAMLEALLKRRNKAQSPGEALTPREAMDSGLILQLEYDLNNRLRPGALPLLSYARTPRLGLQLMADYRLHHQWLNGLVEVRWDEGELHTVSTQAFKSEGDRVKALSLAIADCVLKALIFKESVYGNR